jgi:hypothetical protein
VHLSWVIAQERLTTLRHCTGTGCGNRANHSAALDDNAKGHHTLNFSGKT